MNKKIIKTILLLIILSLMVMNTFATTNQPIDFKRSDQKMINFLINKGVSQDDLIKIDNLSINSLFNQATAYNFTNDQVQLYVKGLLSSLDKNSLANISYEGRILDNGLIETNFGIMPNRYQGKDIHEVSIDNPQSKTESSVFLDDQLSENFGTMSFTGNYRTVTDSNDQTGTYWLVQSKTGYREITAFATLPTINSMHSNDRAYMFFAANTNPSSIIGDYGVVYHPADGFWRPFYFTNVWNSSTNKYDSPDWQNGNLIPSNITEVYLHIQATTTSSNDTVRIRVLNAKNFSQVLWDKTKTFSNNPINGTYSNLNLYRQITMAQVIQQGQTLLNTNTGSWFQNARFTNSYIYSTSGNWLWGTSQTNDAYIKAPASRQLNTITVNSYTKWSAENISMRYNVQ